MCFLFLLLILASTSTYETKSQITLLVDNSNPRSSDHSDHSDNSKHFTSLNDAFDYLNLNCTEDNKEIIIKLAPSSTPYDFNDHDFLKSGTLTKTIITSAQPKNSGRNLVQQDQEDYARIVYSKMNPPSLSNMQIEFSCLSLGLDPLLNGSNVMTSTNSVLAFSQVCFELYQDPSTDVPIDDFLLHFEGGTVTMNDVILKTKYYSQIFKFDNVDVELTNVDIYFIDDPVNQQIDTSSTRTSASYKTLFKSSSTMEMFQNTPNELTIQDITLNLLANYGLITLLEAQGLGNISISGLVLSQDDKMNNESIDQSSQDTYSLVRFRNIDNITISDISISDINSLNFDKLFYLDGCSFVNISDINISSTTSSNEDTTSIIQALIYFEQSPKLLQTNNINLIGINTYKTLVILKMFNSDPSAVEINLFKGSFDSVGETITYLQYIEIGSMPREPIVINVVDTSVTNSTFKNNLLYFVIQGSTRHNLNINRMNLAISNFYSSVLEFQGFGDSSQDLSINSLLNFGGLVVESNNFLGNDIDSVGVILSNTLAANISQTKIISNNFYSFSFLSVLHPSETIMSDVSFKENNVVSSNFINMLDQDGASSQAPNFIMTTAEFTENIFSYSNTIWTNINCEIRSLKFSENTLESSSFFFGNASSVDQSIQPINTPICSETTNIRMIMLHDVSFQNISLKDSVIYSLAYFYAYDISIIDNTFQNLDLFDDQSDVIILGEIKRIIIENTFFQRISSGNTIITLSSKLPLCEIVLSNSSFNTINNTQILDLELENTQSLKIFNNTFKDIVENVMAFAIEITSLQASNTVEVSYNSFSNILISTEIEYNVYTQINLFRLDIIEQKSILPCTFLFENNAFIDISFNKHQPFRRMGFQNSLIVLSLGVNSLEIRNSHFKNIKNEYDDTILAIASQNILFENSFFINMINYENVGPIQLFAEVLTIRSCQFINNSITEKGNGGALFFDYDVAWRSLISITIQDSVFINNTADNGEVIFVQNGLINLKVSNSIFQNSPNSRGSLIYFEDTSFQDFSVLNVNFTSNSDGNVHSFLSLESCLFREPIIIDHIFLNSAQPSVLPSLIQAINSPTIDITISNLMADLDNDDMSFTIDTMESKGIPLIYIDSGYLLLKDSIISNFYLSDSSLVSSACNKSMSITVINSTFENGEIIGNKLSTGIITIEGIEASQTCQKMCQLIIQNSNFLGNSINSLNTLEGLIKIDYQGEINISLSKVSFEQNHFINSAAIASSYNAHLILNGHESTFLSNIAKGEGSTLFVPNSTLSIQESIFDGNKFERGSIIFTSQPISLATFEKSNQFYNNINKNNKNQLVTCSPDKVNVTIIHEDNPFLDYQQINIVYDQTTRTYTLKNVSSIALDYVIFNVSILDLIGQLYEDLKPGQSITFTSNDNQVFRSDECDQYYCFFRASRLKLNGVNNTVHQIDVNYENTTYPNVQSTKILIVMRDCIKGEIFNSQTKSCELCMEGLYSLDVGDTTCKQCPIGANCAGGTKIILQSGFWRSSTVTDEILECRITDGCLGGLNSECGEGRIGALCDSCDLDQGYAKLGDSCKSCANQVITIIVSVVIFCFTIAYECYYIHSAWTSNTRLIKENEEQPNNVIQGFYMRMFTTYFQIATIILKFNLDLPSVQVASVATNPSSQMFLSSACSFRSFGVNNENLHRFKVIGQVSFPIIKIIVFSILWSLKLKCKLSKETVARVILVMVSMFHLEHPGLISDLLSYLNCTSLGNNSSITYLDMDLYVECSSDNYLFIRNFIIFPALFFWGILIPMFLVYVLFVNRKNLRTIETLRAIGTLYSEYKDSIYFWGFFVLALKYLLMAIANVVTQRKTKSMLVIVVLYIYKLFLNKYNPYQIEELNKMENLSSWVFLITVFFVLFYQDNESKALQIIALVVVALVNFWFIAKFVLRMIQLNYKKVRSVVRRVSTKIQLRRSSNNSMSNADKLSTSLPIASFKETKGAEASTNQEFANTLNQLLSGEDTLRRLDSNCSSGQKEIRKSKILKHLEVFKNEFHTQNSTPSSSNVSTPQLKEKKKIELKRGGTLEIEVDASEEGIVIGTNAKSSFVDSEELKVEGGGISTQPGTPEDIKPIERISSRELDPVHMYTPTKLSQFKKLTLLESKSKQEANSLAILETQQMTNTEESELKAEKLNSSPSLRSHNIDRDRDRRDSTSFLIPIEKIGYKSQLKPCYFLKGGSPKRKRPRINFIEKLKMESPKGSPKRRNSIGSPRDIDYEEKSEENIEVTFCEKAAQSFKIPALKLNEIDVDNVLERKISL